MDDLIINQNAPQVFDLKCTVCGTVTGSLTLPSDFTGNVAELTNADMGFADIRCDAHPKPPEA